MRIAAAEFAKKFGELSDEALAQVPTAALAPSTVAAMMMRATR